MSETRTRQTTGDTLDERRLLNALRAMRKGDFSIRLPMDQTGIAGEIAEAFNDIVETNERIAKEVARISAVIGRDGQINQRANLGGVTGSWASCVESVNVLIADLTQPTAEVSRVLGSVAKGDLTQRMALEIDGRPLKGEFLRSSKIVNTMVDQLGTFATEVIRVAREVGIEGKLGGLAKVPGAAGTWRDLTNNVNQLAANLTTQVRAIGEVATAVTTGDLSRSIQVQVQGEVESLKDNINEMVGNQREMTQKNTEQDWLRTNLARFTGMTPSRRGRDGARPSSPRRRAPARWSCRCGRGDARSAGSRSSSRTRSAGPTSPSPRTRRCARRWPSTTPGSTGRRKKRSGCATSSSPRPPTI